MSVVAIDGATEGKPATRHVKVSYKGIGMEWDYYAQGPGLGVLHIICPRCTKIGLVASTNKRFALFHVLED